MIELSGKYVFAPVEVFSDHRLGVIELRVLLALYSFCGKNKHEVYPSRDAIADRSGYGKTTVSRAVSKLVQYGWIEIKQHRGPNTYYLKFDKTVTNSETVTDPETVTNSVINSDRSGQETVTGSVTPDLTKILPIELKGEKPSVPPSRRKKKSPHPEDTDIANWMWDHIDGLAPGQKKPNFETWADDIRKLREIDRRSPDDIRAVFLWAHGDNFWRTNIRSPAKLREKFDDLNAKRLNTQSKNISQFPERKKENLSDYL